MATIRITPTSKLIEDLTASIRWIISLGVNVGSGRLATYLRIAENWDEFVNGKSKLSISELYPGVATFAYEVPAFIAIYHAFNNVPQEQLKNLIRQLKKAVAGPIRIEDETTNSPNPARDFLFEAFTAAYFHKVNSGCESILNSPSDTGFTHSRYRYYIECKRLSSEKGIDENFKKAFSQVVDAINSRVSVRQRGLVALDASKLIRPPNQILQTVRGSQMEGAADYLLSSFINRNMRDFQRRLRGMDRRVIGLMVYSSIVAVADEEQIFVNVGRWAIVRRRHINLHDYQFLEKFPTLMSA